MHDIYEKTKLTTDEFSKILGELYFKNYILIKQSDCIQIEGKKIVKKTPSIPPNKKPLILSFDNVTYKSNYQNLGQIDKIIIDRNSELASYTTKQSIQDRIAYDNEFILILESFIKTHPDFSYNGARGILFFSGSDGILGYNTNQKNATYKQESKRVTKVIDYLKKLGWEFGSNNYNYKEDGTKSEIEFIKELSLWNKEVLPIVKNTSYYAAPQGVLDESKIDKLIENNFQIIYQNSSSKSDIIGDDYAILNRIPINGETLRENKDNLIEFFDVNKVYDNENRNIKL